MKKSFFLSVILLISVAFQAMSAERTNAEMKRVAKARLEKLTNSHILTRSGDNLKIVLAKPEYSIFSNGENFVFVSRNVDYPPILAYGTGTFNLEEVPDAVKWWMNSMEKSLQKGMPVSKANKVTAISPLLTTKWGQYAPFNNYMKYFKKDGSKAPAGCVAIAMAQVMNFNRYPESASFTGSYSIDDDSYTEEVNTKYSWPYNDAYGSYLPEGATESAKANYLPSKGNAVAALCRDCGYAVGMDYNPTGSGASTSDVAQTLIDIFKYPEMSVRYFFRPLFSEGEWMDIIYDELSKGYPLIYSGHSEESGGHAFVADGVDAEGLLHINWGWSGHSDGYYDFRLLNPDGEGGFYDSQQVVTGIRPETLEGDTYGSYLYTPEPFKLSYDNEKRTVTIYEYGIYNYCGKRIVGDVGILFENLTTPEKTDTLTFLREGEVLEMNYGWGEGEVALEWEFAPGNYRVYLASKDVHETEWQMGRVSGLGAFYYEMTVGEDKNVIIGAEPVSTGIESILFNATTNNHYQLGDNIYDLNGRMIGNSDIKHQKGLFIVNGKKVLK